MTNLNLTQKAMDAYSHIEDERVRKMVQVLIKHLHACVKEIVLTDREYEKVWKYLEKMASFTSEERNEYLLLLDVLGVSQLVEDVNHNPKDNQVGYALVGPFLRENTPFRELGEPDMSDETPGDRVIMRGRVFDDKTKKPLANAVLETWQAGINGLYENQDPNQPNYNLRGCYRADKDGNFEIICLMPTGYPVPMDGPVGDLLRASKRRPYRPAHVHFIVSAPGYQTLITQIFVEGDDFIEQDVVFTASPNMIGNFVREGDHFNLNYDFPLAAGESYQPLSPIK
jgi:catechol 1,2-dioxygenase